jgi:thiamine biosynthesis lipoprotein
MATENIILLAGDDPAFLRQAAQEAIDLLFRLEGALSRFLPGSDVSLINALAGTRPVRVGEDCRRVLELAKRGWEATGGAFDPSVGPLVDAWRVAAGEDRILDDESIDRLLEATGMDGVALDAGGEVAFERPGMSLDLGAIGKGHAVDRMARRLQELGVEAGAVISGRSSIRTWGAPPGEERWRFEVAHPEERDRGIASLVADPGAVSSSSASEKRYRIAGQELGHIIDPRSGRPVHGETRSAAAWTTTGVAGEILSTGLFVLGKGGDDARAMVSAVAEAFREESPDARASAFLVLEDSSRWGGLRLETCFAGAPAIEVECEGENPPTPRR